jgi:hypothetical protein
MFQNYAINVGSANAAALLPETRDISSDTAFVGVILMMSLEAKLILLCSGFTRFICFNPSEAPFSMSSVTECPPTALKVIALSSSEAL